MYIDNESTHMTGTLEVGVESWEDFKTSSLESADEFDTAVDTGETENLTGEDTYSFGDVQALFRLFSPRRLELIEELIAEPAESLSLLAERVERNKSEVSRDVQLLASREIIFVESNGRAKRIDCPYTAIDISISVPEDLP